MFDGLNNIVQKSCGSNSTPTLLISGKEFNPFNKVQSFPNSYSFKPGYHLLSIVNKERKVS